MTSARSRYRGSLLGLAAGDAVGTTVEFLPPGTFEPVSDMTGGGRFALAPGDWTDETSMALCLAESLIETGFDIPDQLRRYVRWWKEGHLSSTGRCFDIGDAIEAALRRFERRGDPRAGSTNPETAGNGSLVRVSPVALRFAGDREEAVARAGEQSTATHAAARPVDACRLLGALVAGAAAGVAKDELLAPDYWTWGALDPEIEEIAAGSYRRREPPDIRGSAFVVETLEAALWALARTSDFRDGLLTVVNLGRDSDATGAVYGQLAGALYGEEAIPAAWREQLAQRELIEGFADALLERSTLS